MGESRSLGSLIVRLAAEGLGMYKADMNAAADATGKAGRAADVLGGSLGNLTKPVTAADLSMQALAGAGKMVAGAFAAFKAADLVRDMTMAAARFETMGVVMKVAGNNAGYSGQQTQEYAKALQDSGISMLQSRNAITQLATAHIDLSNAQKLGRAAQDLAVVGNVNSSEALGRLIDGIKSGEVEVLKSLGLNVSFEASYKALAAQMGTTSDKLTEQQKVMARTNTALQEAARYNGIYEESMTTAGKAMTSLTRYWEDFMVKAGDAFLPALATSVFGLTDALKAMNKELEAAGQSGLIDDVAQYLNGALKTALQTVAILGANVAFVFKGMGREIGALAAQAAAVAQGDFKAAFGIGGIGDMVTEDGEKARAALDKFEQKLLSSGEVAARVVRDRLKTRSERDAGDALAATTAAQAKAAEDAAKATKLQAQEYKALNAEIAKAGFLALAELDSGVQLSAADKYRVETLEKLIAAYQEGKLSLQQYIDLESKMTDVEAIKRQVVATKEAAKAYDTAAKAALKYNADLANNNDALEESNKKLAEENELLGLSEEVKARLTLARMDAAIATAQEAFALLNLQNSSEIEIATAQRRIDLMKEQRALSGQGIMVKEAMATAAEWKKTADSIRDSLTDAFMSAIDGTKSLWVALRDSVVGMFNNMVLRPIVQGVMSSVVGGIASTVSGNAIGSSITSSIAGSAAGSALTSSTIASSVTAGVGAFWSGLTASGATAAGAASAGLASSAAASSGAGGAFGAGSSLSTTLGAVPGWGWAALGVAALAGIASGRGETRSGGAYVTGAQGKAIYQQGPSGGEIAGDAARAMFDATKTNIQDTLKLVGSSATITGFVAGLESSKDGKGFAYAGGLINGKSFGDSGGRDGYQTGQWAYQTMDAGQAFSAYMNELKKSTLEALQAATDIPTLISSQLAGVNINALDQTGLDNLMKAVGGTIDAINGFMTQINTGGIRELHDLGFSAAAGLIAASGGLEKLQTNLNGYYTNFYSAEEQRLQTIKTINAATAGSGLDAATATRESFRHLVEVQDLTTLSGQTMYASLMGVAGAFAGIVPAATDAAASTKSLTSGIKTLVSGISTSVSDSIFGMQYGLEDNKGKYNMLDVRGARIDGQMRASTDIADIARLAADQIALLNQAWALMGVDQQKVQLVAFEDKLTAIDDFVKEKGADPVALAKAQAKETADTIAAAVKTAVAEALAAPAASIDSAAASIQAAADTPATAAITVTLRSIPGVETAIT